MKLALLSLPLLLVGLTPGLRADSLYSNTTTDTGDSILYSVGPYTALGDEIQLTQAGAAGSAEVELFNNGSVGGTFSAQLDFFTVASAGPSPSESPVGALLGSYNLTGVSAVANALVDMTFTLGTGLGVPQNLIFAVSVSDTTPGLDLGVEMYEPPTVGSSDPTYAIAEMNSVYSTVTTDDEDVFFGIETASETVVGPEPSTLTLLAIGLILMAFARRQLRSL